jgi:hypothetical protein
MVTPALLTQVSMRPKASTATCASARIAARSATSPDCQVTRPPAALSSLAMRDSAWALREFSTTQAPRRTAARAVASPIPLSAPVMTMTCRSSGFSFTFIPGSSVARVPFVRGQPGRKPRADPWDERCTLRLFPRHPDARTPFHL